MGWLVLLPIITSLILTCYMSKLFKNKVSVDDCDSVVELNRHLQELKHRLLQNLCTARWRILYMSYVDLVKLFLMGKQTSPWLLHLHAV